MYLDFYNLKDKPFRITCDPKYLWLSEKHKEALALLRYGIADNHGFILIKRVFEYTAGIPRLINILCDHALLTGSYYKINKLAADTIDECVQELRIPTQQGSVAKILHTSQDTDLQSKTGISASETAKRNPIRMPNLIRTVRKMF